MTITPTTNLPRSAAEMALQPMYASVGDRVPVGAGWTFEPKYDGVRVLAFATAHSVALFTRNGADKSPQFPEVVLALEGAVKGAKRSFVLDGEIVAVDGERPLRFQGLQSRIHAAQREVIARESESAPVALFAFDVLLDGDEPLASLPWSARRARLEKLLRNRTGPQLRLSPSVAGDGARMLARARVQGWEGLIAKRIDAPYLPGVRTRAWLKLKVEHRQELVIGGYTEPRNSREHLGALLLGYYRGDHFIYAGHTGGGFTRAALAAMAKRLAPLARKTSPFDEPPKTNETAHWVRPKIVAEVKFSEWTAGGRLRQPIFLGIRDDKDAREVTREGESVQRASVRPAGSERSR